MRPRILALILALAIGTMGLSGRGRHPAPSAVPTTVKVGILSDTHAGWGFGGSVVPNTYMIRKAVELFETEGCDAILLAGDWGGGYLVISHQEHVDSLYASLLNNTDIPIIPCLGNWEGYREDTLAYCDPFNGSRARFQHYFAGREYFYVDLGPWRIISVNDNCNYDVADTDDYQQDNPACDGVIPGMDWSGIHHTGSDQRDMIAEALSTRGEKRIITIAHRPAFGSDAGCAACGQERRNYNSYGSGRWMRQILDALDANERTASIRGDQHLPEWVTQAIDKDSTLSGAAERGSYEIILASGSGARTADTTEVFGGPGLKSFLYYDGTRNRGRTTTRWADTLTTVGDPGLPYQFTCAILSGTATTATLSTYRIWSTQSSTNAQYTGAGAAKLMSTHTLALVL